MRAIGSRTPKGDGGSSGVNYSSLSPLVDACACVYCCCLVNYFSNCLLQTTQLIMSGQDRVPEEAPSSQEMWQIIKDQQEAFNLVLFTIWFCSLAPGQRDHALV